jgi:hypothetical protein
MRKTILQRLRVAGTKRPSVFMREFRENSQLNAERALRDLILEGRVILGSDRKLRLPTK